MFRLSEIQNKSLSLQALIYKAKNGFRTFFGPFGIDMVQSLPKILKLHKQAKKSFKMSAI